MEEERAEAAAAYRLGDAGRTEEAEAAVVRVVGGEAGDLAAVLDEEKPFAGVLAFEAPRLAEVLRDEREDPFARRLAHALDAGWDAVRKLRGLEVGRRPFLDETVLCEECSRGAVALDDARREVVSRLRERNVTSEERRPDPAPPVGRIDGDEPQHASARHRNADEPVVFLVNPHHRLAAHPAPEHLL